MRLTTFSAIPQKRLSSIKGYEKKLKVFAKFLNVPVEDLHNHLSSQNLIRYAGTLTTKSGEGRKTTLTIIHRYATLNGVKFDELEYNALKPKVNKEHNDKPLTIEKLRQMMDITDTHGKAFLSFLISTGARASEACGILLSDVQGDRVVIRDEITAGNGGTVYLTSEARSYLDLWLKERDSYISLADRRSVGLEKVGAIRPKLDKRLFGMSYASAHKLFSRLYDKVDGETGKYNHRKCTIHSCRKYFRTHAAKRMHPDLVTNLLRQTGYLDSTYVRLPEEDKRKEFHAGESALYITRPLNRQQLQEIDDLRRENKEIKAKLKEVDGLVRRAIYRRGYQLKK